MDVEQPEPQVEPAESIVLPVPALEPIPEPVSQPVPETVPIPEPEPVSQPVPEPVLEPPEPIFEPPEPVLAPPGPVLEPPQPVFAPPEPVFAPPGPVFEPPQPVFEPLQPVLEPPGPVLEPEPEPEPAPAPEVHEETQSELEARIAAIPRDRYTNIIAVGGRIIIEELDTPATRREKASRRKAEKKAAAAAAAAVLSTRDKGDGHESDLSSLSELESEEEGGGEASQKEREPVRVSSPAPPIAGPSTAPQPAEPGVVVLPEGKFLEGGTLGGCCHFLSQRGISR